MARWTAQTTNCRQRSSGVSGAGAHDRAVVFGAVPGGEPQGGDEALGSGAVLEQAKEVDERLIALSVDVLGDRDAATDHISAATERVDERLDAGGRQQRVEPGQEYGLAAIPGNHASSGGVQSASAASMRAAIVSAPG